MTTINMQTMRYINLLDRVSRVKTMRCFSYNNAIVFVVPSHFMSQAVGVQGKHVQIIQNMLGKRVKIVPDVRGIEDAKRFVQDVVEPLSFRSLEIGDNEIVITAGGMHKASLLGRNKIRLQELGQIVKDMFGKELRII